jgi:glyceraldehyde 3-phosphate dehydrogenase
MARVAINGFGRIGRQSFKALLERYGGDLDIVAINDLTDNATLAHLLRYDTTYGVFNGRVSNTERGISVTYYDEDSEERQMDVLTFAEQEPARLPWGAMGVDVVVEATGRFTDASEARGHLAAGAKKVIITAPAKGEDITICLGVNERQYNPASHHVISSASCTTTCLAPVAKVLNDRFGIRRGLMTTIHAYTTDQHLQDTVHKDLRLARASAMNIIPTTTGATQAVELVLPALQGKFQGFAVRVPTATVSMVDFTVQLERATSVAEINEVFREATEDEDLEGILGVSEEELVSSDFIGTTYSSVIDLPLTAGVGQDLFKVVAWYDNEWGYSMRVADLTVFVADGFEG